MMLRRTLALTAASALAVAGTLTLAAPAQATSKPAPKPAIGTTTVTLTEAALGALGPLNPAPVAPSTLGAGDTGVEATFPITRVSSTGVIAHSGGLRLTDGKRTLALTNYWINPSTGILTARVSLNGVGLIRVPLFKVALAATPDAGCDASADLTLTRTGALALQLVFKAPNLTGAPIGRACVDLA
jgi:hypothetical protein